jgi:multiple sugar transport system permease protein
MRTKLAFRAFVVSGTLAAVVFTLLPYAALVIGSLLPNAATDRGISIDSVSLGQWTVQNYQELLAPTYAIFRQQVFNTLLVSVSAACIVVVTSVPGGYVLTRYRFPGRNVIRQTAIWGYLLPPIILVFPYARLLYFLGLNNTRLGLVLANVAFCFPFGLWLMVQYFYAIPREVDKAAAADGANWAFSLYHVLIPRALPGVATVLVFSVILSWNDVALSLVLVQDNSLRTIAAGVQESVLKTEQTSYGSFAAASLCVAMLAVGVFGLIQRWVDMRLEREAEQ